MPETILSTISKVASIEELNDKFDTFQNRLSLVENQILDFGNRASRTEKLVMLLQLEIQRFRKDFDVLEALGNKHRIKVEETLEFLSVDSKEQNRKLGQLLEVLVGDSK